MNRLAHKILVTLHHPSSLHISAALWIQSFLALRSNKVRAALSLKTQATWFPNIVASRRTLYHNNKPLGWYQSVVLRTWIQLIARKCWLAIIAGPWITKMAKLWCSMLSFPCLKSCLQPCQIHPQVWYPNTPSTLLRRGTVGRGTNGDLGQILFKLMPPAASFIASIPCPLCFSLLPSLFYAWLWFIHFVSSLDNLHNSSSSFRMESLTQFLYPPNDDRVSGTLAYNNLDSVNVSWITGPGDNDFTPRMIFWWQSQNGSVQSRKILTFVVWYYPLSMSPDRSFEY